MSHVRGIGTVRKGCVFIFLSEGIGDKGGVVGTASQTTFHRLVFLCSSTRSSYKLHEEMGRVINLFDWYQAFCSLQPEWADEATPLQLQYVFLTLYCVVIFFLQPTLLHTENLLLCLFPYGMFFSGLDLCKPHLSCKCWGSSNRILAKPIMYPSSHLLFLRYFFMFIAEKCGSVKFSDS